MIKESTEWRKHVEANSSLMKRFDESRMELEKVLKMAQSCLTERGNPEELLKKHTVRTLLYKWLWNLCKTQNRTVSNVLISLLTRCSLKNGTHDDDEVLIFFAGVLWSTGPAGSECLPESLWWADGHFTRAGAAVATGNCQEAAQTLEGQRLEHCRFSNAKMQLSHT